MAPMLILRDTVFSLARWPAAVTVEAIFKSDELPGLDGIHVLVPAVASRIWVELGQTIRRNLVTTVLSAAQCETQ